ncbi:hypothetical protein ACP70R_009880 [Stipagrostis hirtigluma subsp. patula]
MAIDRRSARCAALLLLVCACAAARAVSAVSDGPLSNGNFECPPDRSQMNGSVVTGEYALPSWKLSGQVEYICSGQMQGDMLLTVPEGAHAVRLGNDASIQQQISVTPGTYYSVTLTAARTCAQSEKLRVTASPGQSVDLPIQTVYSSSGWDSYSWAFKAVCVQASIVIHNPGQEDDPGCGPIIDSVSIKTLNPAQSTQYNLLKNGDFEEGPYISQEYYQSGVLLPPIGENNVSPLPGWTIMSYSKVVKYIDSAHFSVPRGGRAVELVSGVETALVQDVDTVPGSTYRVEFSAGDAADGCDASGSPMQVQAYAAEGRTVVPVDSQGTGGYKRASFEFTATETRTRVVFVSLGYNTRSDGSGTLCGPVIDDVSLVCASQPPARKLLL